MSPIPPELAPNLPCPSVQKEGQLVALDRALMLAEHALERMLRTQRWMDYFRCIFRIAMIVGATFILLVILHGMTHATISGQVPSTAIDLLVYLMYVLLGTVVGGLMKSGWDRSKSSYDRDNRYVSNVIGFLREAVKPDDFPTRLEWHLFQFRISRFDIGPLDPWIARDHAKAAQHSELVPGFGERRTWPQGQVVPSIQSPQTTTTSS